MNEEFSRVPLFPLASNGKGPRLFTELQPESPRQKSPPRLPPPSHLSIATRRDPILLGAFARSMTHLGLGHFCAAAPLHLVIEPTAERSGIRVQKRNEETKIENQKSSALNRKKLCMPRRKSVAWFLLALRWREKQKFWMARVSDCRGVAVGPWAR